MVHLGWSRRQAGDCDLPTWYDICELWHSVPPVAVQLARIATGLGLGTGGAQTATPGRPGANGGFGASGASSSKGRPQPRHATAKATDAEIDTAIAQMGLPVFSTPLSAEDAALLKGLPLF